MKALILDTETHAKEGLPIQISHMPCSFEQGSIVLNEDAIFDQYFSVGEKIDIGAMAVHHIIDSDLVNKPDYRMFRLPKSVEYVIGHNVYYDMRAMAKCGIDVSQLKPICTMAIARELFPKQPYNLTALTYAFSESKEDARLMLKDAHSALVDIKNTAFVLERLILEIQKNKPINSLEDLYLYSQSSLIPTFISFGKYKGTALINLPDDYVRWLLKQDDLDQFLRIGLERRKVR